MPGDVVLKPTWGKDQPNNYNGEQNCVVLDGGRNWLWNDVGCNLDYLHFICQHCELHQESVSSIFSHLFDAFSSSGSSIVLRLAGCPAKHHCHGQEVHSRREDPIRLSQGPLAARSGGTGVPARWHLERILTELQM